MSMKTNMVLEWI